MPKQKISAPLFATWNSAFADQGADCMSFICLFFRIMLGQALELHIASQAQMRATENLISPHVPSSLRVEQVWSGSHQSCPIVRQCPLRSRRTSWTTSAYGCRACPCTHVVSAGMNINSWTECFNAWLAFVHEIWMIDMYVCTVL